LSGECSVFPYFHRIKGALALKDISKIGYVYAVEFKVNCGKSVFWENLGIDSPEGEGPY